MNQFNDNENLDHIPGRNGLPFIGNTLKLLKDPMGTAAEGYRKYGPVARGNSFGRKTVSLIGEDANEYVLMDKKRILSSEKGWARALGELFEKGLIVRDFDEHRIHRRIMHHAFKQSAMEQYALELNRGIKARLNEWAKNPDFEFYPAIKSLTLDLAADVFLGVELGPEADKINKAFTDSVQATVALFRTRIPGTKYWRGLQGRKYLKEYLSAQIPQRRKANGSDMFTHLCHAEDDEGNRYSDEEIVDHMIFLLMAAHDTTTSAISSMMYELGKHPAWQEKLRQEARGLATPDMMLTYDQLAQMEKTEWAMKETLRLHPPVPFIPRRSTEEFEFKGHTIPERTPIGINPGLTHILPEYWQDPMKFDPERFSPERREYLEHKFAYAPFGGGAHMCLGLHFAYMQVKIFFFQLLQRFEVVLPEGYVCEFQVVPIPKPKDNLPLHLEAVT